MKNLRDFISQKADIMPQVIPGLFYPMNQALWDAIDEQVWFGICGEVENNLRLR